MILDANAGNQTMWIYKDNEEILHIDFNKKLTVKPDIWCSNICTPFQDETFHIIYGDPPHFYGDKSSIYAFPDMETFTQKFQGYGSVPRYYGGDIYKNQSELLRYIHLYQKEMHRIIRKDGVFILKWNESMIGIGTVLALFDNWHVLMKQASRLVNPNRTQKQTYWVHLCKHPILIKQSTLV